MPKVDLSTFQSAAEEKYGDYAVTVAGKELLFKNALRLTKEKRAELRAALDLANRHDIDPEFENPDAYRDAFRVSASTPEDFEALEAAIGDDVVVWSDLFTDFSTETLSEKASASES